jgi:hypothetical protein
MQERTELFQLVTITTEITRQHVRFEVQQWPVLPKRTLGMLERMLMGIQNIQQSGENSILGLMLQQLVRQDGTYQVMQNLKHWKQL